MRSIIYLLAIYLLALSVVPCVDGSHAYHDQSRELVYATEDDGLHCSPLCFCACCGLILTPLGADEPLGEMLRKTPLQKQKQYPIYQDHLIPSYLASIWHPPRYLVL